MPIKYLYIAKLLVGYAEDAHIAKFRKERLYTLYVNCGILHAGAMAYIDRKLKHGEPVAAQVLTKKRISGAPDKPCGVGRADANPKLLLNDT